MAAKKITRLTKAQEARMPEWRDRWIEIGLSTEPADRAKFEAAVARCYLAAGLTPPKRVLWVQSPIAVALAGPIAAIAIELLKLPAAKFTRGAVRDAVGGAVGDAVRGAVDGAVRGAVGDAVRGAVDGAVRDAVRGAVGGAVRDAVGGAVDGAVRDAVRGAVDGAVGGAVGDAVDGKTAGRETAGTARAAREIIEAIPRLWTNYFGGQFWVGSRWWWGSPSFVSFFREVCELDLGSEMNDRAQAYADTCSSACWWWPHKDFVIACDRPSLIARDDRGRLHSLTGPAIRFRDGWGVYAVHGVRVPAEIILHPGSITPARIDQERNAEIRRVMIDKYGTGRYLKDGGAEKLHADVDGLGLPRVLWRKPLLDDEPITMVEVQNSTLEPDGSRKTYFLRVHPELRPLLADGKLGEPQTMTAHNAVASTFGKRGADYHPILET